MNILNCFLQIFNYKGDKTVLIIRIVIFVLCTFFCLVDMGYNIYYYLQFPFTVNTHLDYDEPIKLPSLTICIPNIVDLDLLKELHPQIYERYQHVTWDKYNWRPKF